MIQDGIYGVKISVLAESLEQPGYFEKVKQRLSDIFYRDVVLPTIGDNLHHVFKTSILRDVDYLDYPGMVNFYLKVNHSVAQVQHFVLAEMLDPIPTSAREICRWCGNELKIDKRGGCKACGAPPGDCV